MKKAHLFLVPLLCLSLLSACSTQPSQEKNYVDKTVHIYHKTNLINNETNLRFYVDQPNVPYIEVNQYFEEFYETTLKRVYQKDTYYYLNDSGAYLGFNLVDQTFFSNALDTFNHHPNFGITSGKNYVKTKSAKTTKPQIHTIPLKNYHIPIYTDTNRVYVPLTFLSKFMGGSVLFNIAYNGKDVYVIDRNGQLGTPADYGAYPTYYEVLNDTNTPRPVDLAKYSYNELCLVFDHFRGLTTQLLIGDNNLHTLGLDGTLETYVPGLKEYLTSTDKIKYYQGYHTLFGALYDGGHTSALAAFDAFTQEVKNGAYEIPAFEKVLSESSQLQAYKMVDLGCYVKAKQNKFDYNYAQNIRDYYYYDATYKTSYIGFDSFKFDYQAWDNYYTKNTPVPIENDSFAFIRAKLLEAKSDGAENIVLDLTTNGGGAVAALIGIVSLFNQGTAYYSVTNTFNKIGTTEEFEIDLNLDGKWDENDAAFANQFDFNVGVLTSHYSFSCGNLLPCVMKELGYKILGDRSGGGSCSITYESTADGLSFVRSSANTLSTKDGSSVDDGVPVDLEIVKEPDALPAPVFNAKNFFDPEITGTYLSTAYKA